MVFKVMSWNCQSVRNKKIELCTFVQNNNIDIIQLSETWLAEKAHFYIPSFDCYRVDRSHGGVAILIKNSIPHSSVTQISLEYAEAVFLKIHDPSGDFFIGSIYCSPAASREKSQAFFSRVLSFPGRCILAGDFNAKHFRWNSDKCCRKGSDLVKLCDSRLFSIHGPNSPTLIPSVGNPSTVDFVLSKGIIRVSDPKTINDLSSDHCPILYAILTTQSPQESCQSLNFAKANWKRFRQLLDIAVFDLQHKFPTLDTVYKIDECIDEMNSVVSAAIKDSVPLRKFISFRYPFSTEIHNLIKSRNLYRRKFKQTRDPAFRSISNQLSRVIKYQTSLLNQRNFDEKIASLNTRDYSVFRFTKTLKSKSINTPPLNNENSTKAFTNQDKAAALAKGFLRCHQTTGAMRSKKENPVKKSIKITLKNNDPFPSRELVKETEINAIIQNLKKRKASGSDKISNSVIKNFSPRIISFLAFIFNSSLKLLYFPKAWKLAKIIAIPKHGKDVSSPDNYRPISLLSCVGKIYERIILDKLLEQEKELRIIIPEQFGFRNGHSTTQQILRITEHTSHNFNLNRSTGLVLLDIEKAFDSVWHDALIHKLYSLKFPIFLVKIVQSYLCDRKAFVEFNGKNSDRFDIPAGVPQGSLLSPLLFNIFINDIPKTKSCHLAIYADDTALYCDAPWKNVKTLKKLLENGLVKISKFFEYWKIKINSSKTEFAIFTRSSIMKKRMPQHLPVFGGNTFKWKETVKYLGVTLDQKLNFKSHISNSIAKTNKVLSTLYCVMKKNSPASFNSKLTLYKTNIRPILSYACPVFANCPKAHFNRLQIMQNKCLRMILSAPFYTRTADLHSDTKLPTIRSFVDKLTDNFYRKSDSHSNELISSLGWYTKNPPAFRVKHKMPRPV